MITIIFMMLSNCISDCLMNECREFLHWQTSSLDHNYFTPAQICLVAEPGPQTVNILFRVLSGNIAVSSGPKDQFKQRVIVTSLVPVVLSHQPLMLFS